MLNECSVGDGEIGGNIRHSKNALGHARVPLAPCARLRPGLISGAVIGDSLCSCLVRAALASPGRHGSILAASHQQPDTGGQAGGEEHHPAGAGALVTLPLAKHLTGINTEPGIYFQNAECAKRCN